MATDNAWKKIFDHCKIGKHDFNVSPFIITADQIKVACQNFKTTSEKEPRILCKQDSREERPQIFKGKGLFILPLKNGKYSEYAIIQSEGYVDIPAITTSTETYASKLDFELKSSAVGDSEMQHLDFAYASSLIRTFTGDDSLVLTIRGRKYTPEFSFKVNGHSLTVRGVQTEVDAGYEGRDKIVLVEAKNTTTTNTIIRQLFYPYRKWTIATGKDVIPLFFERHEDEFHIWQYRFNDPAEYNSIELVQSRCYKITTNL